VFVIDCYVVGVYVADDVAVVGGDGVIAIEVIVYVVVYIVVYVVVCVVVVVIIGVVGVYAVDVVICSVSGSSYVFGVFVVGIAVVVVVVGDVA